MSHDLIIRNGTLIDGTGAAPTRADVAVDGDRITAVGDLSGSVASREIDAAGLTVTPGFVDLHTHLDAQIGWDPLMTSSSWHGVTTTLIGNCGVSFAPAAPQDREYLAEMMESVEDIPRHAILSGLPWTWQTYPQYLDVLQDLGPALNVVGLVGHCAIRHHVMGERALDETDPTAEELSRMRDVVAESVAGGAVGYSTSRILEHRVPDGRCVPGTYASVDEHLAMADGMNDAGGGVFQGVMDFVTRASGDFQLLRTMAERSSRVLFAAGPGNDEAAGAAVAEGWGRFLRETCETLGSITGYTMTRPSGTLMGLAQVAPVRGPAWRDLMALPTVEDRLAVLRDPARNGALLAEAEERGLWYDARHIHPLGNGATPDYHEQGGRSVAELADEAGVTPFRLVLDRLLESDGRELFNVWFFHRNRAGIGPLLALDEVYPGAADTGAHAGQICDADAATHFLSHWVRDRGLVPMEQAIHRLSGRPASLLGLIDRGTVRVGAHADLNILDPAGLQVGYPTYVNDFPGGAGRLTIGASGYAATLVNGVVVTEHGTNTGARPGRVLRTFART